jgi:hypothetical protein
MGGCGNGNSNPSGVDPTAFTGITEKTDSSDLPTWKGKQLTINYWIATGRGGNRRLSKSNGDVVTPEIKRVTGVTVDEDNSFDNAGQDYNTKLGLLNASKGFPSIGIDTQDMKKLIDTGKIYDLTNYIKKYAPNLQKKLLDNPQYLKEYKNKLPGVDGYYFLPYSINTKTYMQVVPNIDNKVFPFYTPKDPSGQYVFVRDDILRKLYPNAKTEKQIEDIWVKQGYFTKDQVYDVSIKSKEEFVNFLRDINKLNLTEDGRKVYPIFAHSGQDTWAYLNGLNSILHGWGCFSNLYTYWDKQEQKVDVMLYKPEYKEGCKFMTQIVREGLSDQECFVETYEQTMAKLNRGQYAVSYSFLEPNNEAVKQAGKSFQFRKLYLDIPVDTNRFIKYEGTATSVGDTLVIFKDAVPEQDVAQIVRWYDFLISDAGEKLYAWGPRSAGLFEEKDGKRAFKDQALVDNLVNGIDNPKGNYYNIYNNYFQDPIFPDKLKINFTNYGRGKFAPEAIYGKKRNAKEAWLNFNYGRSEPIPIQPYFNTPDIWVFPGMGSKTIDNLWSSRKSIEDPMIELLVQKTDADFNKKWDEILKAADSLGLNNMVPEFNKIFETKINQDYMDNIKNLKQ